MERRDFLIKDVPAVLFGMESEKVILFVHGLCGSKNEAEPFAQIAVKKGWQVLGIDLPEHGGRTDSKKLNPWDAIPELRGTMDYIKSRWKAVALRATSIGAWLSLIAFKDTELERGLLVSPVVDMEVLIKGMMYAANVSEERLKEEKEIAIDFGQPLSWDYFCFARDNKPETLAFPSYVLYGENDEMVNRSDVDEFTKKFNAKLTVMQGGEHWFHTDEQTNFMSKWESACLEI